MKFLKTWLLVLMSIVIITLIATFWYEQKSDIKETGVLFNAEIVELLIPSKGAGSFNFRCRILYNGEQKELISPTSLKENGLRYIGKHCPALYSISSNNLRVLLRQEDFEEFNVPLTDSLVTVINKIN